MSGEFLTENTVGEFLSGEFFGEFLAENPVGEFLTERGEFLSGEFLSGEFLVGRVFVRTPNNTMPGLHEHFPSFHWTPSVLSSLTQPIMVRKDSNS